MIIFPKKLISFLDLKVKQCTVRCREVLHKRKKTLFCHVQTMVMSAVMTEVLVPSIYHLHGSLPLLSLNSHLFGKIFFQLNDFCNSIGSQLKSYIGNFNDTNNGIMILIKFNHGTGLV